MESIYSAGLYCAFFRIMIRDKVAMDRKGFILKIFWVTVFAIAMAFVESSVVVYLRVIYYPEGFKFPLKLIMDNTIKVELYRELATLIMLLSVAVLAGRRLWERFAWFLLAFGVWDIFYYVWLNVLIGWPSSLFEWDILFLIPLPWIGPVIAPMSISLLMIIAGIIIISLFRKGHDFRPSLTTYILASAGVVLVLYSFMWDTGATLYQQLPQPYHYEFLIIGDILFVAAFISYVKTVREE